MSQPKPPTDIKEIATTKKSKYQFNVKDIVWRNVLSLIFLHCHFPYAAYLFFFQVKWATCIWTVFFTILLSNLGVTAGAHRLWTHRSYKAKLPLRIFLMICQTSAAQTNIHEWARDHRVHHKFSETNADPHNSLRGFFFSHVGWLLVRKHKDVINKGKTIDLSDLHEDPVVMFQKKYYFFMVFWLAFFLPAWVPWYFWGEDGWHVYFVCALFRYIFILNGTWSINSVAHMWGYKPYDKTIEPVECKILSFFTGGEGWHNYHHVFPWDYKAAELGTYPYNWTTAFIDLMAFIGQAYDRKTASPEMVQKRVLRTGNGTKKFDDDSISKTEEEDVDHTIWGWGDKAMKADLIAQVINHNKLTEL